MHGAARGHGRLLRRRRGPRRPHPQGPARHRGRGRGAGRGGVVHLRGACLRHPLGHALGRGPAPVPGGGVRGWPLRPLRRDERAAPRRLAPLLAGGGGHRARRGLRGRDRRPPPPRHAPRDRAPDQRGGAGRHGHGLRRGRGTHQTHGQAGVARRQAHTFSARPPPRARCRSSSCRRRRLAFLHPMPIRALWGVGPATARRLDGLGVQRIGELARIPTDTLCRALGSAVGRQLAELARGEDPRPVEANREAKSVGHEETFAVDVRDQPDAAPPRGAHGGRGGHPSAQGRGGGADGHHQGALRRPHHHHPLPHGGGGHGLAPGPGGGGRGAGRRRWT